MDLKSKIEQLLREFDGAVSKVRDNSALQDLRNLYLSRKKGHLSELMDQLKVLPNEKKREAGQLINAFKAKTGIGLVVNTSFNVRGEPIVCTPEDAYRCFMRTAMDGLVIGNFFFAKETQPSWKEKKEWLDEFELD